MTRRLRFRTDVVPGVLARLGSARRRVRHAVIARARALSQRVSPCDHMLVFAARPIDRADVGRHVPEGVTFREVLGAEVEQTPASFASSPDNARMCISGAGRCFVGESSGRVVLRMWTLRLDDPAADRFAAGASRFGPAAVVHDCWTSPSCRGRGVYAAGLRWMMTQLMAEGIQQFIMTITPTNTPAIRGCEKAGFVQVGVLRDGEPPPRHRSMKSGMIESREPARTLSGHEAEQETDRSLSPASLVHVLAGVIELRGAAWIVGTGGSMFPTLRHGDAVLLESCAEVRKNDIVLFTRRGLPVIHRVVSRTPAGVHTRGDAARVTDGLVRHSEIVARAVATAPYRRGEVTPGFRLVANGSATTLGPVTPLVPTLKYGVEGVTRYIGRQGWLLIRRMMLRIPSLRRPLQRSASEVRR